MKKLYAIIFVTFFSQTALAAQTMKVSVNGMVCAFCAQGIEKKLRALSQTKDAYVNLKQRIVAVEIKESQTLSQDTVKDLIKDAGYDVTNIEISELSAAQIKAELKGVK